MTAWVPMLAVAAAAVAAVILKWYLRRQKVQLPSIFLYLTFILPFAAGGFHTYTAMFTTILLLVNLIFTVRQQKRMRFVFNLNTAAVLFVALGYCITPFWAADRGMAVFAIVRYLPAGLYILTWMQYSPEQKGECLALIPLSGAFMTVFSCALLPVAGMESYLTVNGRLSGFFQYPNTYAAFLLAGLVLHNTKSIRKKTDPLINAVLILGVILSGSRTAFLLLMAALLGIVLVQRRRRLLITMVVSVAVGLMLAVAASELGLLQNADRFTSIGKNSGSFLVRLLYFKDAFPVILKNPFGLGYYGYRALEGTFQTGRYTVSFIHNGLLQMLLDIGWAPSLLMAAAFLRALLSKKTAPRNRLLLFVVLGHCMLDFDLQFFVFWVILLSALDFDNGEAYVIRKGRTAAMAACALIFAVSCWLGTGDLCSGLGYVDASLTITPFHTDALTAALQTTTDVTELDSLADRILELNPTHSLAYSGKANAAYSRGQVEAMMEYKEQAIRCAPYSTAEYCDYFEKLYTVMQMYLQAGDRSSAAYCAGKLFSIPDMMDSVSRNTDPMAYLTGDDTTLVLPEEYTVLLDVLKNTLWYP